MSVRGAEATGATGPETKERRAAGGQRVHFEALVAVGGASGGSGFEAESVDVSPDGMRLRTAYLPEIGDKLVCRFDNGGSEIVAEGEVIWRNEEAKGGEFGLHFVGLDAATAEALKGMCNEIGGAGEDAEDPASVARGARVRLHIEGLGSPMKARVRDAASKAIEVGSNLEFLRVGRALEVEDCDKGGKRDAVIDDVKVDVDPSTNVPQLVVSLRYQKAGEVEAAPPTRASSPPKRTSERPKALVPPRKDDVSEAGEGAKETRAKDEARKAEAKAKDTAKSEPAEAQDGEGDDGEELDGDEKQGAGARALSAGRAFAGKIGPALSGMSSRARGAMIGLAAAMKKKRAEGAEAGAAGAPRRTTAPPPGGALKAEGRRLVREDEVEGDDAPAEAPRKNRRAAVTGAMLGLIAVLSVVGIARVTGAPKTATAEGDAASALTTAAPSSSAAALPAPADTLASANGTPTANVPLFGATPLSTTEPVPANPAPADSALAAAAPAGDAAAPGDGDGESDDEASAGSDDAQPAAGGPAQKQWGQGSVSHPIVLKLKMDGPIERISGAAGAMGFTVSLPDRRALSTEAAGLARKDKRIASINVVNTSHGAEVTLQFKDGVPGYLAKAKGDRLEIALGTEGHHGAKKVAKAKKKGEEKSKSKGKKKHHK